MNGLVDEFGRALLDLRIRSTGNDNPVDGGTRSNDAVKYNVQGNLPAINDGLPSNQPIL